MLIPKRVSIIRIILLGMLSIVLLLTAFHWGEWYFQRNREFQEEVGRLEEIHLTDQKQLIRREVNSAIDFVRFQRAQLEKQARQRLKARVDEAHLIATHLYQAYQGKKSEAEIFALIKETLRGFRFEPGRGYIFATNLNGTAELFPFQPELEGKNLLHNDQTVSGQVARQMIELIEEQQEGFITYDWHKPQLDRNYFAKIAYLKHFAPANWYLGSGAYIGDLEEEAKNTILERINHIRFGDDGFLFALNYDSRMIAHAEPNLIGNRMLDSRFPDIRAAFPAMLATSKENGGFIEYRFRRPGQEKISQKISYVAHVPEWEWIIGAGFFLDTLEAAVATQQQHLRSAIFSDTWRMLLLSGIAIGFSVLIARVVSTKLQRNLELFSSFFSEAASKWNKIDEQAVMFHEFDQLAHAANKMIAQRSSSEDDRKQMEAQLLQSQKLEALGTLAGGIAHDFNNLLASICGNVTLLTMKLPKQDERHKYLLRLNEATDKAKSMVAQILSFSRSSEGQKDVVDLACCITDALQLMRASIPTSVEIETNIQAGNYPVLANKTQLHQVLLNLCSNAYQALPEQTGSICFMLSSTSAPPAGIQAQTTEKFAHLAVSDTGCGIPDDIIGKIFDPFFTTKEQGKGTGLGLAIAHRIVSSFNGLIEVESRRDQGTTFRLYLPLTDAQVQPESSLDCAYPVTGSGTVMLVDDDLKVLESTAELLEQIGYRVIDFSDPLEALAHFAKAPDEIDILITDQTMPGLKGLELIAKMRLERPDLPIILCTGYSEQVDESTCEKLKLAHCMLKPVSLAKLSQALKKLN